MEKKKSVFCRKCNKKVNYHYEKVNHIVQFIVTVLSGGLWLPMWLMMIFGPTKICDECNNPIWKD
jgi:hypothetical protein